MMAVSQPAGRETEKAPFSKTKFNKKRELIVSTKADMRIMRARKRWFFARRQTTPKNIGDRIATDRRTCSVILPFLS